MKFTCAEHISFYTVVANFSGPLAAALAHIDDATHIKVAKYEALYLDAQQLDSPRLAVASQLHIKFAWAESISFGSIVTTFNGPL